MKNSKLFSGSIVPPNFCFARRTRRTWSVQITLSSHSLPVSLQIVVTEKFPNTVISNRLSLSLDHGKSTSITDVEAHV